MVFEVSSIKQGKEEKMNPKYWRTQVREDKTTKCPWCEKINDHRTGRVCKHVYKVTKKGICFYYWGFAPYSTLSS